MANTDGATSPRSKCDQDRLAEAVGQVRRSEPPHYGKEVVHLVDHDPVRAPRPRPQGLKVWKELGKEIRAILQGDTEQVDHEVHLSVAE